MNCRAANLALEHGHMEDACAGAKMTAKQFVLRKVPMAFCCRATWGGFHVWEEGSVRLMSWGKTPALAWIQCKLNFVHNTVLSSCDATPID